MKKLKIIFLAYVLASVTSCIYGGEGSYSEEKLPAYANKSEETVKIISIWGDYTLGWTGIDDRYEKNIYDGDTLHYMEEGWSVPLSIPATVNCGFVSYGDCDKPIRMELHFLDDSQKCLIFDGPIKNDGIDMRSWNSYKRGKKIDDWAEYVTGVEYVYTITPEHKAMAKEENCQNSAAK
ncbi:MAG: hypothetical protein LBC87_05665 [Fibromonadaceae bacterium]|jgi:hypothetical protein|nr:hypothetical protein [Fibromonadaceae bacterium]